MQTHRVVTVSESERISRALAEQQRLYGAPLHALFDEVCAAYDVNRARLARVLGLSAPMLSQLASGHRIKIGNPMAAQRLQTLLELAEAVLAGDRPAAEVLTETGADTAAVLGRTTRTQRRQGAHDVQAVLRWAASAEELEAAARLLEPRFGDLARVLRVYGTGRTPEAERHFRAVVGE